MVEDHLSAQFSDLTHEQEMETLEPKNFSTGQPPTLGGHTGIGQA